MCVLCGIFCWYWMFNHPSILIHPGNDSPLWNLIISSVIIIIMIISCCYYHCRFHVNTLPMRSITFGCSISSTPYYLHSCTKYLEQSKEIQRNWMEVENSNICFCIRFDCYSQGLISESKTGYLPISPPRFKIFLIFLIF